MKQVSVFVWANLKLVPTRLDKVSPEIVLIDKFQLKKDDEWSLKSCHK